MSPFLIKHEGMSRKPAWYIIRSLVKLFSTVVLSTLPLYYPHPKQALRRRKLRLIVPSSRSLKNKLTILVFFNCTLRLNQSYPPSNHDQIPLLEHHPLFHSQFPRPRSPKIKQHSLLLPPQDISIPLHEARSHNSQGNGNPVLHLTRYANWMWDSNFVITRLSPSLRSALSAVSVAVVKIQCLQI